MSHAAIALAARDALQTAFQIDKNSCEVAFDGMPNPSAGEFYVGVHPLNWQGINGDFDLHEEYSIGVTITLRMAFSPQDSYGIAVWTLANKGLEPRARVAITTLHHNQQVRIAANLRLNEEDNAGRYFVTPLQFLQAQPVQVRDYNWFTAKAPPKSEHDYSKAGVSQTLVFGKCQRCQAIDEME